MLTIAQAISAREFHHEPCTRTIGPRGGVSEHVEVWRANGKAKTWKTRPTEFRVPVKFGMYGFDYVDNSVAHKVHIPDDCPLNDPTYVTTGNRGN